MIVEISDKISVYFSDAGLRLQRFSTSEEQGKCQLSSVHFSEGEHKELVDFMYDWKTFAQGSCTVLPGSSSVKDLKAIGLVMKP